MVKKLLLRSVPQKWQTSEPRRTTLLSEFPREVSTPSFLPQDSKLTALFTCLYKNPRFPSFSLRLFSLMNVLLGTVAWINHLLNSQVNFVIAVERTSLWWQPLTVPLGWHPSVPWDSVYPFRDVALWTTTPGQLRPCVNREQQSGPGSLRGWWSCGRDCPRPVPSGIVRSQSEMLLSWTGGKHTQDCLWRKEEMGEAELHHRKCRSLGSCRSDQCEGKSESGSQKCRGQHSLKTGGREAPRGKVQGKTGQKAKGLQASDQPCEGSQVAQWQRICLPE